MTVVQGAGFQPDAPRHGGPLLETATGESIAPGYTEYEFDSQTGFFRSVEDGTFLLVPEVVSC